MYIMVFSCPLQLLLAAAILLVGNGEIDAVFVRVHTQLLLLKNGRWSFFIYIYIFIFCLYDS